jgi:diguanylate cyclase (GGDEF)-like protein
MGVREVSQIGAGIDKIRRWLAVLPEGLEQRYLAETAASRVRQIRFWIAISLAFNWMTWIVDLVTLPDVWWKTLALRLFLITPVSLIAIRLLAAPRTRWAESLLTVAPFSVALATILVGFSMSAQQDPFRSVIVLSTGLMWVNVIVPMRLRDSVIYTAVTFVLGYAIIVDGMVRHHAGLEHLDVVVVLHALLVLAVLARFQNEREARHNFVLGLNVKTRAEDLARSNARLVEISNTDPLTGLANRRSFDSALTQAWRAAVGDRSWVALAMVDIDYFKAFNDAAGHLEGDRCLTGVAGAIGHQVRHAGDLAARFGGEEFVVLMPATELETAHQVADRLRAAVAGMRIPHPGRKGSEMVTVSVGVAAMRPAIPGTKPEDLIAAADAALYEAKGAGRNRVMVARQSIAPAGDRRKDRPPIPRETAA